MSKCRTFDQILNSPDTIDARRAIEELTRNHHINEVGLRRCVRLFRVPNSLAATGDGVTVPKRADPRRDVLHSGSERMRETSKNSKTKTPFNSHLRYAAR